MLRCFVPTAVICLCISAPFAQDSVIVDEEETGVVEQTVGEVVTEQETSAGKPPAEASDSSLSSDTDNTTPQITANEEKQKQPDNPQKEKTAESSDDVIVGEEDLFIISDEEESILSIKKEQPPAIQNSASDSTGSSTSQSLGQGPSDKAAPAVKAPVVEKKIPGPDSRKITPKHDSGSDSEDEVITDIEPVVESTRSINFAKNASEYRSPKKAMFLSMLVPGLGQAYVKNYLKSALFGVAEAAIIGVAVNYHMKGSDQKRDAREFADNNYDHQKLNTFYDDLKTHLQSKDAKDYMDILGLIIDSNVVRSSSKADNYYHAIEENAYVQGWKDAEPRFTSNGYQIEGEYKFGYKAYKEEGDDSTWLITRTDKATGQVIETGKFGFSEDQGKFRDMVSKSTGYYKVSTNMLFLLLANHLASAVDALFSAKAHNDALLERETLWHRIRIDQGLAFTGTDMKTKLGVKVRF